MPSVIYMITSMYDQSIFDQSGCMVRSFLGLIFFRKIKESYEHNRDERKLSVILSPLSTLS